KLFIVFTNLIEKTSSRFIPNSLWRPLVSGVLLIALFKLEGSGRFHGLGINYIQDAFEQTSDASMPFLKIFFTALTVATGFKGGEFTPLAFIGATAGSSIAAHFPVSTSLFAAVGFAAVFGAASKTPIACAVMGAELFGIETFPYMIASCLIAFHSTGM